MRLKQTYGRRRKRYATCREVYVSRGPCSVPLLSHVSVDSHDCGVKAPCQLVIFRTQGLAYESRRLENVLTVRARKTLGDNVVLYVVIGGVEEEEGGEVKGEARRSVERLTSGINIGPLQTRWRRRIKLDKHRFLCKALS